MKTLSPFRSSGWTFFANRPSALERAVRPSPKSRRLRMEPLENRALLAVDAFGVSASLADSDGGESWSPDPEPAAFSASVLVNDAADVVVYWRDGSGANGAELSGNPNGGGLRVFPEQTNSNEDSLRNQVDLVFRLDAAKSVDTTVYCRLLDPDNYISLGNNQSTDGSFAPNDNNWSFNLPNSVVIPAGEVEYVLRITIANAYAGDNFIVVADTDSSAVAAAALGSTKATRYQLVQSANNQPAYSPLLTVWRTLWVEGDRLEVQFQNSDNTFAPTLPTITGAIAEQFERACIKVRNYSENSTISCLVNSAYISDGWNNTSDTSPQYCATQTLDYLGDSNEDFWYVHTIVAIRQRATDGVNAPPTRIYTKAESQAQAPTLFVFDTTIWDMQDSASTISFQELRVRYVWKGLASVLNVETSPDDLTFGFTDLQIAALQSRAETL